MDVISDVISNVISDVKIYPCGHIEILQGSVIYRCMNLIREYIHVSTVGTGSSGGHA